MARLYEITGFSFFRLAIFILKIDVVQAERIVCFQPIWLGQY